MTTTYSINVPSGKYTIERDNDSCIYNAFEHFVDNVLTRDDIDYLGNIDDFDVFNVIEITNNA